MSLEAKRIINGTWGEVWLDSDKVIEAYGIQAKLNFKKEDVQLCGQMGSDKKITGFDGTGSLRMHKANSRMAKKILKEMMEGRDVRFTIITKLSDPDSYGTERVALKGVSFDDLTIADWESGANGKVEAPFTFTKVEYLDMI
ncbi:MAG: phage tail tube protein [Serratia marcescens]|nr:phage tail tube protein [Serratia marcescens]